MYLYYTVSSLPEDLQAEPQLSLGGFKSSNKINNSIFNNLFSDISVLTVSNYNQNRYIGLVLKNETGDDIENIALYFVHPVNSASLFRVAAVDMAADSNGNLQMEHVNSVYTKPIYAEFHEASAEGDAVDLGSLDAGEQIGIWIEMKLLVDSIKTDIENICELNQTTQRFTELTKDKSDEIEIKISWGVVVP